LVTASPPAQRMAAFHEEKDEQTQAWKFGD
jgi:hypothetical protein